MGFRGWSDGANYPKFGMWCYTHYFDGKSERSLCNKAHRWYATGCTRFGMGQCPTCQKRHNATEFAVKALLEEEK